MVTHGGIDWFLRTIVFLKCSDNNLASTVLTAFINAVTNHGLLEQICSDLGVKMLTHGVIEQYASANVIITGSSTHNERIEHLW